MKINYLVVLVSDMHRSVAFYRDVVGLPLKFESPSWSEFAAVGACLALHAAGPAPTSGPKAAGSCRQGFGVPNLDAFHQRMLDQEVPCVEPPKAVFGARFAQYLDPDGLPFSVGEERR